MKKYIAWDMDGVLVDLDECHRVAVNKALDTFGITITREEHQKTFKGLPTRVKCEMLTRLDRLRREDHVEVCKLKQDFTRETIIETLKPDPEKIALLKELKALRFRQCICTNSVRDTLDLVLDVTHLYQFVEFGLSNEDIVNPKPAPDVYLEAAKIFKVQPEDVLVVEDALPGIKSAMAAGCEIIKVNNPGDVTRRKLLTAFLEGPVISQRG